MASAHASTRSILSAFLPRLSASTTSSTFRHATLYSRQLSHPLLPAIALPASIQLNVPGLLEGIWESILRAVPKKRTSHMKKRTRQMAGKGLKDVTSLNKCSVCGNVKRAHLLCPFCVKEIQDFWRGKQTKQLSREQMEERAKALAKGEVDPFEVKGREERKAEVEKIQDLDKDKDQDVKY